MPLSEKGLNAIFMGTPDFAVPALKTLDASRHKVALVVTQPDRPKGRGRKLAPPPVKSAALELALPVVQPDSVKTERFLAQVAEVKADILVVVAFGHLLPMSLLALPSYGAVNIHASLLPKYRGAAPIHWAVINGERVTGVTIMCLDEGMDSGDTLISESTKIGPQETTADLHERLSRTGAGLLIQALDGLQEGSLHPRPQNHSKASYAPMLKKADGRMKWNQPAQALDAFVRGMTPWPGAFTFHGETRLKIWQAKALSERSGQPPGTVLPGADDQLRIATQDGVLGITEIQGASGKRLAARDFLRGYPLDPGSTLS